LIDFQCKLPFAEAQMGKCYLQEILPQWGQIRDRESNTAVFEHFCEPNDKTHPKIDQVQKCMKRNNLFQNIEWHLIPSQVRDVRVWLYSACHQMDGKAAE